MFGLFQSEAEKEKQRKEDYRRGYEFAFSAIMLDKKTPFELECYIRLGDEGEPFNRGMMAGVNALIKGVKVEDDHPMSRMFKIAEKKS